MASRFLVRALFVALLFSVHAFAQSSQLVSVTPSGSGGNSHSESPSLSSDGRAIAFASRASDLVSGSNNGKSQIYVQDFTAGSTEVISVSSVGEVGNNNSYNPSIASEGRAVVFDSASTNLIASDTNLATDIFLHDRVTSETFRASVASDSSPANAALLTGLFMVRVILELSAYHRLD